MTTQIVLLRGINVGGHNKIPMKELQSRMSAAGFADVRTYIASGNILLRSPDPEAEIATRTRQVIAEGFGLDIPVVVRTAEEVAAVAELWPFPPECDDLSKRYVTFFDRHPPKTTLDPDRSPGDRFAIVGREAHLYLAIGAAKTRLSHDWFEKQLRVTATARNWNTVLRLRDLSRA